MDRSPGSLPRSSATKVDEMSEKQSVKSDRIRKSRTAKRIMNPRSKSTGLSRSKSVTEDRSESTGVSRRKSTGVSNSKSSTHSRRKSTLSPRSKSLSVSEPNEVYVDGVKVSREGGLRKYNKKHHCFYCGKLVLKMSRHLARKHSDKDEVAKAFSLPKNSKERHLQLDLIRNKGNFKHNTEVLERQKGELIPYMLPQHKEQAHKFTHCPYCFGLYRKRTMWHHFRNCKFNPQPNVTKPERQSVRILCALAHPVPSGLSDAYWTFLGEMNQDGVAWVLKTDNCLLEYGQRLFKTHGKLISQRQYIRQKLRELCRLVLEARKVQPVKTIKELIKPEKYSHVVAATRSLAGCNQTGNNYHPTLARKMGHSLNSLALFIISEALKSNDKQAVKDAEDFVTLYEEGWRVDIASEAPPQPDRAKWNIPQLLPFARDVQRLHRHLSQERQRCLERLQEKPSALNWKSLAKVTLVQVMLFNRRRTAELSQVQLSAYLEKDSSRTHRDSLTLTVLEEKLCQQFESVATVSREGWKVPVLLTPLMKESLEILTSKREECAVWKTNGYLFALTKSHGYINGYGCIRQYVGDCKDIENPKALTSTRLRKITATLSTVLNLKAAELDQLSDLLGVNVGIRQQRYRLPETSHQLAKVAKALLAIERGRLGQYAGRSLDEIQLDVNEKVCMEAGNEDGDHEDANNEHKEMDVDREDVDDDCEDVDDDQDDVDDAYEDVDDEHEEEDDACVPKLNEQGTEPYEMCVTSTSIEECTSSSGAQSPKNLAVNAGQNLDDVLAEEVKLMLPKLNCIKEEPVDEELDHDVTLSSTTEGFKVEATADEQEEPAATNGVTPTSSPPEPTSAPDSDELRSNCRIQPTVPLALKTRCGMCCRNCASKHEIIWKGLEHQFCSKPCFLSFCVLNDVPICQICHTHRDLSIVLRLKAGIRSLCSSACLAHFKQQENKTLQPCSTCASQCLMSDMVEGQSGDGTLTLFCSSTCVIASKIQSAQTPGVPLRCDHCSMAALPACHLAMADASIRSFCSLSCAMTFKENHKDSLKPKATGPAGPPAPETSPVISGVVSLADGLQSRCQDVKDAEFHAHSLIDGTKPSDQPERLRGKEVVCQSQVDMGQDENGGMGDGQLNGAAGKEEEEDGGDDRRLTCNNQELSVSHLDSLFQMEYKRAICWKEKASATTIRSSSRLKATRCQKQGGRRALNAWKRWIKWRRSQTNLVCALGVTLSEDVLRCSPAQLSEGLAGFVSEVRRSDGRPHTCDRLLHLCLDIQKYLFDNSRKENIFFDPIYNKFSEVLVRILQGSSPSAGVHSCVDEALLWGCKQLGAHSPLILLNTVLYFCSKHLGLTTVEQHRQLCFAQVICCTKTNRDHTKTAYMRFYPPLPANSTESDGIPAKKRKVDVQEKILEVPENKDNPLQCPVRFYRFYLSKCSESSRERTDTLYLQPQRSCVPSSSVWFSSAPLDDHTLETMLALISTARELHGSASDD